MDFNDTYKFIEDNRKDVDGLCSTFPAYNVVMGMLDVLKKAVESEDITPPELDDQLKRDVNCLLDCLVESILDSNFSAKEREILETISIIFGNFSELFDTCFTNPLMLRIFILLVSTSKTLEDQIALNTFLYSRIKSWFVEESQTTMLSRKYFNEYLKFLEDKDHDDPYSPDDTKETCCCPDK